jgi:glycosyltransferase involved in cell wall biosynthesis
MKKILFISPYFPPMGGSGVFRAQRLVKYLPEFGFQPLVVHFAGVPDQLEDQSLVSELGAKFISYPVKFIEPSVRGIQGWLRERRGEPKSAKSPKIKTLERGFFLGLGAWMRDRVLIPDLAVTWIPLVLPVLDRLVAEHHPQAVFTTSSPETSHLLGWHLKRKYGLPWIADFRDPWTESVKVSTPIWPLRSLERYFERQTLLKADFVIAYSHGLADLLRQKVPADCHDKFIICGPAVDTAKFDSIEPGAPKFDFLYTGYLDWLYPRELFFALDSVNRRRKEKSQPLLQMGVAGRVGSMTQAFLEKFLGNGWLSLLGYLSHNQTLALLKSARSLVLLHPDHKWWLPGKVAEYLYSGKPILAVINEGELKEIMKKFAHVLFLPNDRIELMQKLEKVFELAEEPRELPLEFSALGQAEILADLFGKLINNHNRH